MLKRERTLMLARHGGAPLSATGGVVTTLPSEFEGIRITRTPSCQADTYPLPPPAALLSLTAAFAIRKEIFGAVEVEPGRERPDALVSSDLALAQVRHARRALEGALEHGASLLAALGLPRLVEPGFVLIDPMTAGDAIEAAIAALDAMDDPDDDIEDGHDAEHETSDAEHCLGWNETVSQLALGRPSDDGDETALECAGRGFVRSGPEDAEDDDPGERDYRDWPADADGLQDQFAGLGLIPTLAWSVGGYVG